MQAVQTEDPTPLYAYFTIWSAVASALGWVARLYQRSELHAHASLLRAHRFSAVGTGLSARAVSLQWGFRTQPAIIAAIVVLHLFLPIAIIARRRFGAQNVRLSGRGWLAPAHPQLLAFVPLVATATQTPSPYIFPRPLRRALRHLLCDLPASLAGHESRVEAHILLSNTTRLERA